MVVRLPENVSLWLPRALLLLAIWGMAVFLWGTFGAWTRSQYVGRERALLQHHAEDLRTWLEQAVKPLDRLANDPRIPAGMNLPTGVESLPVQRVIYEYGYLTRQTEVYIVDLLRKRVGRTAGAAPLPAEVMARLADLPDSERMMMGMGARNGQMLLVRKINAPLPNRLLAIVPVSLGTLASGQPAVRLPEGREIGIVVPHPTGWAEWRDGSQGFMLDDMLEEAMKTGASTFERTPWLNILEPLPGWPSVRLNLQTESVIGGTRLLPQLLVGVWAIMMSLLVLGHATKTYHQKALTAMGPVIRPVEKLIVPMRIAVHSLSDAIATRWEAANRDVPLVDGPGDLASMDFASPADRQAGSGRTRNTTRKLKLMDAAAKAPAGKTADTARRPHPHTPPKMAWPDHMKKPGDGPDSLPLPSIDTNDIRAVVEDCLRKKRIKLLYQPIYRAGDGMPVMHEVYARLVKLTGEVIAPDVFMPIVTRHKMALELDLAVLRKVVHDHFGSGGFPMTPLALNISSTSLDGIAYLQEMSNQGPRVLQKTSFEVRSQEMIRDPKALKLLKELQRHGGNLAVDYFGGGKAMLEASKTIGFNYVKMNCAKFLESDSGKAELSELCRHAQGIGLPIILEMVGDDKALDFALNSGAEFLQGYALGRPRDEMNMDPLPPNLNNISALAPKGT